jgi:hypothetical protein
VFVRKLLLSALVLAALAPAPAFAGIGTTAYMGGYTDGTTWIPSLDIRNSGVLVQIHLLDQLIPFTQGGGGFVFNTGVDVTTIALKKKVAPDVEGVIMPGGGIRLAGPTDGLAWNVMAEARMGMEMKQGAGFGVYVVPALGVTNGVTGDVGLNVGGTMQVEFWLK